MFGRMGFAVANAMAAVAHRRHASRFSVALDEPAQAQSHVLSRILKSNVNTAYGREFGLARLNNVRAYQSAVPPADYDALDPWIHRALDGERAVLTAEPILMFEKTSGSTRAAKYIPYTASLRHEFQAATGSWLYNLWSRRPKLRSGGWYWSLSPLARQVEFTPGGLPVGFSDDTEYFDPLTRWVLGQLLIVPGTVAHCADLDEVRFLTLRHLLASSDLAVISVWNPTFLTLLVAAIEPLRARLQRELPPRRARLLDRGLDVKALWPRLDLISCWTEAGAGHFLPELRHLFPGIDIQGKGLLSTEGVVSIPLVGYPGGALAVTSHFLEFVPEGTSPQANRPALAHELDIGGRYGVLLTTGGGLYRYLTHDAVEVVGRVGRTPLVRFVGRDDHVSDLFGEKLAASHVEEILAALFPGGLAFSLLAPELGSPSHYVLFFERLPARIEPQSDSEASSDLSRRIEPQSDSEASSDLSRRGDLKDPQIMALATALEVKLRRNPHYQYCRDLGQLGAVRLVPVVEGARKFLDGCVALGQKPGNIKPAVLHKEPGWARRFGCSPER